MSLHYRHGDFLSETYSLFGVFTGGRMHDHRLPNYLLYPLYDITYLHDLLFLLFMVMNLFSS